MEIIKNIGKHLEISRNIQGVIILDREDIIQKDDLFSANLNRLNSEWQGWLPVYKEWVGNTVSWLKLVKLEGISIGRPIYNKSFEDYSEELQIEEHGF